jgi:hypothetical protein
VPSRGYLLGDPAPARRLGEMRPHRADPGE